MGFQVKVSPTVPTPGEKEAPASILTHSRCYHPEGSELVQDWCSDAGEAGPFFVGFFMRYHLFLLPVFFCRLLFGACVLSRLCLLELMS